MLDLIRRLWKDEEGHGMVEYGLIIALVSIVVITALIALGGDADGGLVKIFNDITDALNGE